MRFLPVVLMVVSAGVTQAGGSPAATAPPSAARATPADTSHLLAAAPQPDGETPAAASTAPPPRPFRAAYSASYNGMAIATVRTFKAEGEGYLLATRASNFLGSIGEEEVLTFADDGSVLSGSYSYQRAIFGNKRKELTTFDRDTGRVTNTYKKRTVEIPLQDALYAPLGYQLQLRRDLMAGHREFHYRVVSRGKIRDYRYTIKGAETLDTPLGKIATLVLERERDTDERQTFLWLAKNYDYLPVKLVHSEDGDTHTMLIESYTSTSP